MKYTANATMAAIAKAVLRTTILIRVRNTLLQFMVLHKYHKFGCLCFLGAHLSIFGTSILPECDFVYHYYNEIRNALRVSPDSSAG